MKADNMIISGVLDKHPEIFRWLDDEKLHAKLNVTLKTHTEEATANGKLLHEMGYIDGNVYQMLETATLLHDSGKANNKFQLRISAAEQGQRKKFSAENEIPHQIISAAHWLYIAKICGLKSSSPEVNMIFYAIWQHHPRNDFIVRMDAGEENFTLEAINRRIKADVPEWFDVAELKDRKINDINKNFRKKDEFIRLVGLLRHCDHCASAGIAVEQPNDFLLDALGKFFRENKFVRNDLQEFCAENSDKNIIAVAPTGSGKTEAALSWLGNHKGFFVLPLRTAINAMYYRIKNNIVGNEANNRVGVLHSGMFDVYGIEIGDEDIFDLGQQTRMLTFPLTVSTPDQLFSFVFRGRQYENIFAVLSYSKIIIDEIQSYSADLLAFIIYGLKKIAAMGAKIAIVTATLPPFVEQLLREAIPDFTVQKFSPAISAPRHFLHVEDAELTAAPIAESFQCRQKRILVICNTVRKAQEIYAALAEIDETLPLNMLHSRFTRRDRRNKEQAIQSDDKTPQIWVTTSLVEASLDIDYDEIFTELSDLPGLLQRMGRCNRRGRNVPTEPNCFVYLRINSKLLKTSEKDYFAFIDKRIYELSREALLPLVDSDALLTEATKIALIDNNLTIENIHGSYFEKAYYDAMTEAENIVPGAYEVNGHFRDINNVTIIPSGIYEENKEFIDGQLNELKNLRTQPFSKAAKKIIDIEREIMDNTVDIAAYYMFQKHHKLKPQVLCEKEINKFNKIFIYDCDYYSATGFRYKAAKGVSSDKADGEDCFL